MNNFLYNRTFYLLSLTFQIFLYSNDDFYLRLVILLEKAVQKK